jgi:hypothetical protein
MAEKLINNPHTGNVIYQNKDGGLKFNQINEVTESFRRNYNFTGQPIVVRYKYQSE